VLSVVNNRVTPHVYVVGTADYFALNQYASYLVTLGESGPDPSYNRDGGTLEYESEEWPISLTSSWESVRILVSSLLHLSPHFEFRERQLKRAE
jgi:hypothetical protein